jgi:CsoR family transcriptional regulator, copper-sensing transcriptional repressor
MDDKVRKSSLARLARIEGQVRGVARMVEADRYCIDVLTQLGAVRATISATAWRMRWAAARRKTASAPSTN